MMDVSILFTSTSMAALIATAIISLLPNVILLLLPVQQQQKSTSSSSSSSSSIWLALGQAIGAGGLLADVFLHTLSESTSSDTGMYIVLGFTIFLAVDLFVRSVNENHSHSHHHNDQHTTSLQSNANDEKLTTTTISTTTRSIILLNLVADSLHNFTDGLAIGASYSGMMHDHSNSDIISPLRELSYTNVIFILQSHSRGGMATLSICLHEIPHELSDFCTLVRAGYSTRQAILLQLVTAIAAFAGTIAAIIITTTNSYIEDRLLWSTAGGFLYLSCTTILPEVLNFDCDGGNAISSQRRIFLRFVQFIAFCIGLVLIGLVDWFSDDDHHHHHHHHDHHAHSIHHHDDHKILHDHEHHHDHSEL